MDMVMIPSAFTAKICFPQEQRGDRFANMTFTLKMGDVLVIGDRTGN
jgi:hypothetical protein